MSSLEQSRPQIQCQVVGCPHYLHTAVLLSRLDGPSCSIWDLLSDTTKVFPPPAAHIARGVVRTSHSEEVRSCLDSFAFTYFFSLEVATAVTGLLLGLPWFTCE